MTLAHIQDPCVVRFLLRDIFRGSVDVNRYIQSCYKTNAVSGLPMGGTKE